MTRRRWWQAGARWSAMRRTWMPAPLPAVLLAVLSWQPVYWLVLAPLGAPAWAVVACACVVPFVAGSLRWALWRRRHPVVPWRDRVEEQRRVAPWN